jgi:anaerobic ribonucleoside-triphosphate reductase
MNEAINTIDTKIRATEILMADEDIGICEACGEEQAAEQDARNYECEACGEARVQGAMVLIGMA